MSRPWTPDEQEAAAQMRAEGWAFSKIAFCLGRDVCTIRRRLDPNGDAYRELRRQYQREYTSKNRDKERERRKEYYRRNRGSIALRRRARLQALSPETKRQAKQRALQRKNERYASDLAYRRRLLDYQREWRERQKMQNSATYRVRRSLIHAAWRSRNPLAHQAFSAASSAQRRSAVGQTLMPMSKSQWAQRIALFGGKCAYCQEKRRLTVDHVLPIFLGGDHSARNVVPACGSCNSSKGAQLVDEWFRRQPFFTEAALAKIYRHTDSANGQIPLCMPDGPPGS